MQLTFLGTGTSTGVPQMRCQCPVCLSHDQHDKRLRASAYVEVDGHHLLIDCGPDVRSQLLSLGSPDVDCVLLTHTHYDHVGGIDDMRPYCAGRDLPVYCRGDVARDLKQRIPYSFAQNLYLGVPTFDLHIVDDDKPFDINGLKVTPLPIFHGKLPILGYRIGKMAYVTDCSTMPDSTVALLRGVNTLVINALRIEPHPSHMSLLESLALIDRIKPRRAYLTHFSHQIGLHRDLEKSLPDGVFAAYDGLKIDIPSQQ